MISIGFELVTPAKTNEKFISKAKKAANPIRPPNRKPSPIRISPPQMSNQRWMNPSTGQSKCIVSSRTCLSSIEEDKQDLTPS
jgi:hypothetical protein